MDRIKWMYDGSAKHQKINQLALDFGHQSEKRFLLSSAEESSRVDTFNTRSVPAIAFAESDPQSSLFFGKAAIDKNVICVNQKEIDKSNTRFDKDFLNQHNGGFKVP